MNRKIKRIGLSLLAVSVMYLFIQGMVRNSAALVESQPVLQDDKPVVDSFDSAVQRLTDALGGSVLVSQNSATGVASFVRLTNGATLSFAGAATPEAAAGAFFAQYGSLFGIKDAQAELELLDAQRDTQGAVHLVFRQVYQGVDVFAGILRVHLNGANEITAVNGVFVPDINLAVTPALGAGDAAAIADRAVNGTDLQASLLASHAPALAVNNTLYLYHTGLLQNIAGPVRLVYEVEVSNNLDVREFVYVDAFKGEIVNQISGIHEDLDRQVHVAAFTNPPVWVEGDALPYAGATVAETIGVNNLITATEDVYDFFFNTFSFDSWDNLSGTMHAVWNDPTINCPNANWNGTTINFCDGTTADDVIAHEWGHAYTESTHGLIYQWQSGALNESYSDIWGELIDQINSEGTDFPATARSAGTCSIYGGSTPPSLNVNAPLSLAGPLVVAGANFNTIPSSATGDVVLVDDGDAVNSGSVTDACEPLVNGTDVDGNIALVDRGSCAFVTKATNALNAGATGVIVANNTSGVATMGGTGPIAIPSVMVSQSDGALLKANLPGVNVTIDAGGPGTDDSYQWLMGEDAWAFGTAIRDMWNPTCFGDPGKVSDTAQYICTTDDSGGVHTNSGIPNHAFALLIDGGTYNGVTVDSIGMVKAAHIYWQAQSVYQTPSSNFQDHADALETSCSDLTGVNLTGFDGNPSGEVISGADCTAVANALLAVEMRAEPTFCGFTPLLQPNEPPVCQTTTAPFFSEGFLVDPGVTWPVTNTGVFTEYVPIDWAWQNSLPDGRSGGFYGYDPARYGDCVPGSDDQSGVRYLDSPLITLPTINPDDRLLVTVDHYVATELGWDGGNVWVSVNGGAWQMIPSSAFVYNAYNATLETVGDGNTNPLAGQPAFSGTDGGTVNGSWGVSQIDLTNFASSGDDVQLRFALGVDGCNGVDGWYIDQVEIYSCVAPAAAVSLNPTSLDAGTITVNSIGATSLEISNPGDAPLDWSIFDGTLHDQPNTLGSGIISTYFSDPPPAGAYTADDFTLAKTTTVISIVAPGFVGNGSGNLTSASEIAWYIYPDASGEPAGYPGDGSGTELWSFTAVTTTAGVGITGPGGASGSTISLDLDAAGAPALQLPPGTYWFIVYPTLDSTVSAQWNHAQGTASGAPAMLYNDGLFGSPSPGWHDLPGLGISFSDVSFTLFGYTASCADPTASGVSISPSSGTIAVSGSQVVNIDVDATGQAEGSHTVDLCLSTNAPAPDDEITVPLVYEVEWLKQYMPVMFR